MRTSSALAAAATIAGVTAAFDANSKTNVVAYWGRGAGQGSLLSYCQNPNVDIINIGFVDVFPDQGKAGWPGTDFGNACGSETYTHNNVSTDLLSNCPDLGPDIVLCQQFYGTKIFLSIGGATANGFNNNDTSAQNFANFLWGSFGPSYAEWIDAGGPRPFGDAVVDGFDFDIESELSSAPTVNGNTISDYKTRGWAAMASTFRSLYAQDATKTYYLSAAPQCVVPDSHLSTVIANAWFDFIFVQFYKNAQCSPRAALASAKRATGFGGYDNWASAPSLNPNVRVYLGLAASPSSAADASYYVEPAEANTLVKAIYSDSKFGGIMLWQASAAEENMICNKDYATWMKQILDAQATGTTINTDSNPCPVQPISKDGLCGGYNGQTCVGSIFGTCCSQYGYCGDSSDYCSAASCDRTGGNCGDEFIGVIASPGSASNNSSSNAANTTAIGTSADLPVVSLAASGNFTNSTTSLASAAASSASAADGLNFTAPVFVNAFAGPSTQTIYSTQVFTITSCAPEVTDCPAHPESQTVVMDTSTYAIGTTVVIQAAVPSTSADSTTTTSTTVRVTSTVYRTVTVSSSTLSAEVPSSSSTAVEVASSVPVNVNVNANAGPYTYSNATSSVYEPTAGTISSTVVQLVTATLAPVQDAQVSHVNVNAGYASPSIASTPVAYNATASSTLPAMAYFTGAANRAQYGMGAVALAIGALMAF